MKKNRFCTDAAYSKSIKPNGARYKKGRFRRFCFLLQIPRSLYFKIKTRILLIRLWYNNFFQCASIIKPSGPVVSLTTYGRRIRTVYLAIESIARGNILPSRLILWIDDAALFENLPKTIRRLVKRGLEVKFSKNYGPHTKYYPYLQSQKSFDCPMATADDDILYPRSWLQKLTLAYQQAPQFVLCYRAHIIELCGEKIASYAAWKPCKTTRPALIHFATGVSGVLYPPAFLARLKQAGNGFIDCCPEADDVWLHVQAVRFGFPICQIENKPLHFPMIPGTQKIALMKKNLNGGNDRQIKAAYTAKDISKLRSKTETNFSGSLGITPCYCNTKTKRQSFSQVILNKNSI